VINSCYDELILTIQSGNLIICRLFASVVDIKREIKDAAI